MPGVRTTFHISRRQATNSRPAILLAEKIGAPLNVMVTINFTLHGVTDEDVIHRVLARLRNRYCRWAKEPGKRRAMPAFTPAMLWVVENTGHFATHMLVHVPEGRMARFQAELEAWLKKDTGIEPTSGVIDIRPIHNVFGVRKYALKGIDPKFAALYRIRAVPQGAVRGKRFGYTQNLGPTQCRLHGTKTPYRWPGRAS